ENTSDFAMTSPRHNSVDQQKLSLTEPIGTFKQSEVAIQRLLQKTNIQHVILIGR
ncbi:29560_t:CDS:1, partial [Gigaspora margarita]